MQTNILVERYQRFARQEAAGRSAIYEAWANHVAVSPSSLAFLGRLPRDRQQPNLFFAALRAVAGIPTSADGFATALEAHAEAIAKVMLTRTTQTNEPGRCAVLLPSLARVKGPISLIEVGASAGLCLLPDAYGYDWQRKKLAPPAKYRTSAPIFPCRASASITLPDRHPDIVWRVGLDLNPLDVSNIDDVAWLEALVWPEHQARLERLRQALGIAKIERPRVITGDLRRDLDALISEAPRDTTVVVFHTAVLSYVTDQGDRDAFADRLLGTKRVLWLNNESPRVFPQFSREAGPIHDDMFLLTVNGRPSAWTGPHGQELRRIG